MGQGRHRNRRRRGVPVGAGLVPEPVFFEHPFSSLGQIQNRPALAEFGRHSEEQFRTSLAQIDSSLSRADPLQILASLSAFGLTASIRPDGEIKRLEHASRVLQAHVELAQALALRLPSDCFSRLAAPPELISELFELLPRVGESFMHLRLKSITEEQDRDIRAIRALQELMRVHTQNVRNWGYIDTVRRISTQLFEPLNPSLRDRVGFTAHAAIKAFSHITSRMEKNISMWLGDLSAVMRETSVERMLKVYYSLNPQFASDMSDIIAFSRDKRVAPAQMKAIIVAHAEFRLPGLFSFTVKDIAREIRHNDKEVTALLNAFSYAPGSLSEVPQEHLLLDNPVWRKPIIKISDEKYFCAIPQTFFSFITRIFFELTEPDVELHQAHQDTRSSFLEKEVLRTFSIAFPGAKAIPSYRWSDGDREYENDLIILIDSHLLLVEAKSHMVTMPALRGADRRLQKHIRDILVDPSVQSARLADRIRSAIRNPSERAHLLPNLDLDLDKVRCVLRLSVTLEDMATLQSNLNYIRETGWIPTGHTLAPAILLSDLQTILEILPSRGQRLHYLRRRTELARDVVTDGDELDHLGLYLGTGFANSLPRADNVRLSIHGMSEYIDRYCVARAEGRTIEKPIRRLSTWWLDICQTVEARAFERWSDVLYILLSQAYEDQQMMEDGLKRMRSTRRKDQQSPKWKNILLKTSEDQSSGIAIVAFEGKDFDNRKNMAQEAADKLFAGSQARECLVIAKNIENDDRPYSFLAMFSSGQAEQSSVLETIIFY